jgi:hypothetical protein
MDPKLMAILQKAKAVDMATATKTGEVRAPSKQTPVSRDYFDEPEVEYLSEAPTQSAPSGGSGLFDQMGVSSGGNDGGPSSAPLADRMDVNSNMYNENVNNSKLPESIRKAMLENPIPMGDNGTGVSVDDIKRFNPNGGQQNPTPQPKQPSYSENDEKEYYNHPIEPTPQPREIPNTQKRNIREQSEFGESDIRKMIAQEIAKALPIVIEQYFDKRVLKENVSFKAGDTTFSGTVTPLPKKRTKKS